MKHFRLVALLSTMTVSVSFAQYNNVDLNSSASGANRISFVKNSIDLDAWHEKSFWPLYGKYSNKLAGISMQAYHSINDLALLDKNTSSEDAYNDGIKLINSRNDLLGIMQEYYIEIAWEFNGVVALQFLQTEALLDLMESYRVYETTSLKQFRFYPKLFSESELKEAKCNVLTRALSLTPVEAEDFYKIYARYEEECDALLGEDYNLIGFYAGEAADYTPAIAKHLGYDFLRLMKRENKLKEKYFNEINNTMGSSLAARFLAWEDYYSIVSKMYAWADAP